MYKYVGRDLIGLFQGRTAKRMQCEKVPGETRQKGLFLRYFGKRSLDLFFEKGPCKNSRFSTLAKPPNVKTGVLSEGCCGKFSGRRKRGDVSLAFEQTLITTLALPSPPRAENLGNLENLGNQGTKKV